MNADTKDTNRKRIHNFTILAHSLSSDTGTGRYIPMTQPVHLYSTAQPIRSPATEKPSLMMPLPSPSPEPTSPSLFPPEPEVAAFKAGPLPI